MLQKFSAAELRARISAEMRVAFPDQINFDRATAAKIVGVSRGYLSNCELAGKPLLPIVRIGRKPLVQFPDMVDFLVAQRLKAQTRCGPRTKAAYSTETGHSVHGKLDSRSVATRGLFFTPDLRV